MEEASRSDEPNRNPNTDRSSNPNPLSSIISSAHVWPTIDGPLGLTEEASVDYARRFYKFGFALLPWLWAVNCFYFWPVLRHSRAFPQIRNYVVRSAVGFSVFTSLLLAWALTFSLGGEQLFGPVWDKLVMYNVADRLGLSVRLKVEKLTMEIEGEDGTKLILKPGEKAVFGRGAGFTTDDLTVSRRHVSLELKPFAGETDSDRVSLEVLGRNPVWVRKREPGEKIQTFRKSETGEVKAGDRFCVSGQLPIWFTLKRRDERVSDGESGLDCIDSDPVKEFGFLVIGKEFDQYPKSRIRDVKQWEWFLEDSTKGNSDDDDEDDGDKKGRKGLSKKRRRGKKRNEEDDDWSAESEEDKELIVKSKRVVSPTRDVNYRVYSTRSKKTKKDVNASSSSSSSRAQTKQRGSVDIDEEDEDETLGGFIVSDEEAELEEEDEPNTDDDEEVVEEEDEDEDED